MKEEEEEEEEGESSEYTLPVCSSVWWSHSLKLWMSERSGT